MEVLKKLKNILFLEVWDNIRNIKPPFIPKPFFIQNLDIKMNLKNNKLDLYTSKEIQNRGYNNLKNMLNKIDLNIYDFYYNKDLEELKYNLENNITELIKKQIKTYTQKNEKSKNILKEIDSEEFISTMPSGESDNNKIFKNMNIYNSTNIYNSEIKNKYPFLAFDKNDNEENKILKKKKTIQIIPIRNLLFNHSRNINYNNKKDLLFNSIRFGSSTKNRNKNYMNMTERKYNSKSIFKDDNINTIKNTEKKISSISKIKEKQKRKENIITNVKTYNEHHEHHEHNKMTNIENDKRRLKINGKLFTIKKNLGKYY